MLIPLDHRFFSVFLVVYSIRRWFLCYGSEELTLLTVSRVALGMCLIGAITWVRSVLIVISQLAGAIAAGRLTGTLFSSSTVYSYQKTLPSNRLHATDIVPMLTRDGNANPQSIHSWRRQRFVPWTARHSDVARWWNINRTRTLHRDVSHRPTSLYDLHACCRKA